jgi:DNA polymerase/3'-5' exonuclease PolX
MVSNADVAQTLERIADLEIRGENTFSAEQGLYRIDDGARVAGQTEQDVNAARGLPRVPPHRREASATIDAAAPVAVTTEV